MDNKIARRPTQPRVRRHDLVSATVMSRWTEVELEASWESTARCALEELSKVIRETPRETALEGMPSLTCHWIIWIIAIIETLPEFWTWR